MAVFALASDLKDLRQRLGRIVVASIETHLRYADELGLIAADARPVITS